jgi:hypothetical protein
MRRPTRLRRFRSSIHPAVGLVAAIVGACATIPPADSAGDARAAIRLAPAEREHLRAGMRGYLDSVQGIVDAATEGKMARVASSARKSGMASVSDLPLATATKFPAEFLMLSVDTHRKFDTLADTASGSGAGAKAVMAELRDILANCSACHASYKLSGD